MNAHTHDPVCEAPGAVAAAADGLACGVAVQEGGCTDWTSAEEMTLVQYMQHAFEPNFNALDVQSLLPTKSEQDIQQKWKELTASMLSSSSSTEHKEQQQPTQQAIEDIPPRKKKKQKKVADDGPTTQAKEDNAPRKKKKQKKVADDDADAGWTEEEDLQLLIHIMESQYSCKFCLSCCDGFMPREIRLELLFFCSTSFDTHVNMLLVSTLSNNSKLGRSCIKFCRENSSRLLNSMAKHVDTNNS